MKRFWNLWKREPDEWFITELYRCLAITCLVFVLPLAVINHFMK